MESNGLQEEHVPKQRPTEVNPATAKQHRKEWWWQVLIPIIALALLGVGAIVLMLLTEGAGDLSVVADYVTILMLLLVVIVWLPVAALLIYLITLMRKANTGLSPYAFIAQEALKQVYEVTEEYTTKAAEAVISFKAFMSGVTMYLKARGMMPDTTAKNGTPPSESKT